MRRPPFARCFFCALTCTIFLSAASAEPPIDKPLPGPAVGGLAPPTPAAVAAAKAEEERNRPIREASQARDDADLKRSAFEARHRAGPLPKDAADDFAQVVAAYEKAIDRPTDSPDVMPIVVNARIRLAGAYQFTGQFDKAIAQVKKAVELSAGTRCEVEANFELGLMYLQALHDPASALPYLKRAQELVPALMKDPGDQAKWLSATSETIVRCEREARK
jgi:tetratricopeptide (TPR) repeat protein